MQHEARGRGLRAAAEEKRQADVHHIRVRAGSQATSDNPSWLVEHYSGPGDKSLIASHHFTDPAEFVAHVLEVSAVPENIADERMDQVRGQILDPEERARRQEELGVQGMKTFKGENHG